MPYSQFDIQGVRVNFGITIIEKIGAFSETIEIAHSNFLKETLRFNSPIALAINSEKARSEMITALILLELKRLYPEKLTLSALKLRFFNQRHVLFKQVFTSLNRGRIS